MIYFGHFPYFFYFANFVNFANFANFLYPTFFIVKIVVSASITSYIICKYNGKPFFNPKEYSHNYILAKLENVKKVSTNIIINYNLFYYLLSKFYLHDELFDIYFRIFQMIKFICILEFIAYIYHRLSHEIQFIYKNSHYIHHKNIVVYPIDSFEFDSIDSIALLTYFNIPLYFVPMNWIDYSLILYVYTIYSILIHSDIFTKEHIIHHRRFKYNYSIMIPIFDIIFGTYATHHEIL